MSASPVPPGAPLDVDAVERDLRYVLTVVPASPSVVPDALEDALALCAEVRRLRTLVEDAYWEGITRGSRSTQMAPVEKELLWDHSHARAALAPAGGDTDA